MHRLIPWYISRIAVSSLHLHLKKSQCFFLVNDVFSESLTCKLICRACGHNIFSRNQHFTHTIHINKYLAQEMAKKSKPCQSRNSTSTTRQELRFLVHKDRVKSQNWAKTALIRYIWPSAKSNYKRLGTYLFSKHQACTSYLSSTPRSFTILPRTTSYISKHQ